jgi:hypothetical protein
LPPRPDPVTTPQIAKAWTRIFGKGVQLIPFELDFDLIDKNIYRLQTRRADVRSLSSAESSSNWSGGFITSNAYKRLILMMGRWRIPANLTTPPPDELGPPYEPYLCAQWIGLDGQYRYIDSSLPQMGTTSTLQGGMVVASAWTQWWARDSVNIGPIPLGIPVAPGDEVACIIGTLGPHDVLCIMVNLTYPLPIATAVKIHAPLEQPPGYAPGTPRVEGATAEWIVERPRYLGKATRYAFPDYHNAEFHDCVAIQSDVPDIYAGKGIMPRDLQGAQEIRMYEVLPNPARTRFISMPTKFQETSIYLHHGGFR